MHILFCVNKSKFGTKCFVKREQFVLPFIIMEILEKQDVIFKEVVIEEETIALLHASIERLPPQSSKIMKYVLQGRSNVEVAQEMGISVNTVKTLKYNAMKTLKEELKELYYVFVFILGERDLF